MEKDEQAEIGKYACEHGIAKAVRLNQKKLARIMLETTVRSFQHLYHNALKRKVDE